MFSRDRAERDFRIVAGLARALPNLIRSRPGQEFTVPDAIEAIARRSPNQVALAFESESVTYAELNRSANQVGRWAIAQGLNPGDVVALLMENRPEFVVIWLGLAKAGLVTALINTNLRGGPLAHSLKVSQARHLIVGESHATDWNEASLDSDLKLETWVSGGTSDSERDFDADRGRRSNAPLPASARAGRTSRDDLFYIYTSGTTGLPKAARFSHQRFLMTSSGSMALGEYRPSDRVYITLPLYHTAGGIMALGGTLLAGATAILSRKFSASRFWEDCVRHDATVFQYIGELCRYLVNSPPHPDEKRHRLRLAIGNGLRPEVWPTFQERFGIPRILEFYGATEGNISMFNLSGKVGAVGRIPSWVRRATGVHVLRFDVDAEDVVRGSDGYCTEADVGEPGELVGRLNETSRFEGYTDAAASEKKILRDVFKKGDAYFRTGDLLKVDDEGYFTFVDRVGDTFRWKGENVSTGEVAEVLSSCSGIEEANVYGVEVPGTDGRAGMASLVVDETFSPKALLDAIKSSLPAYARPLFLRLLPEIETTGTFKHRKVDSVREGFDPVQVADPLYLLDSQLGEYVVLNSERHAQILSGELRL